LHIYLTGGECNSLINSVCVCVCVYELLELDDVSGEIKSNLMVAMSSRHGGGRIPAKMLALQCSSQLYMN
jgi:hypothetical protein